jgi:hypothetical protein
MDSADERPMLQIYVLNTFQVTVIAFSQHLQLICPCQQIILNSLNVMLEQIR